MNRGSEWGGVNGEVCMGEMRKGFIILIMGVPPERRAVRPNEELLVVEDEAV